MVNLQHYVQILKKHEETRASTNERNEYWKRYIAEKNYVPQSKARFEHG